MDMLLIGSLFMLFFIGPAILFQLGWVIDYSKAPGYQKLYPSFYILFGLVSYRLFLTPFEILKERKIEIRLLVIFIFLLAFMIIKGESGGFALIINCLMLPVLLSMLLPNSSVHTKFALAGTKRLILIFFVVECLFAILERLIGVNFFTYANGNGNALIIWLWDMSRFRSTALLGHPLSNALCVSVVLSFILISDLKDGFKYALFCLGIVSILCFNTRSSLLAWGILFPSYILHLVFFKEGVKFKKKIVLTSFLFVGLLLALYLIIEYDFAGRIIEKGINDSSAGARIGIWRIFENIKFYNLVIGHSSDELSLLMRRSGFYHIENYWLIFLIRFGIIFTSIIIALFIGLFKKYLAPFHTFETYFLTACFVLLSSTNNSLAVGVPAVSFFFVCCVVFNPNLQSKLTIE